MKLTSLFVSGIFVSGAHVPNCFVKELFGLLFMAICYFSVDSAINHLKYSGNTASEGALIGDGHWPQSEDVMFYPFDQSLLSRILEAKYRHQS